MDRSILKGRWKQWRGRCRKAWGKATGNLFEEFLGERDMIDGKIEEHYARSASLRRGEQRVPTSGDRTDAVNV
jgi:uncharacterized protein YjbJ (UPF0337 family)